MAACRSSTECRCWLAAGLKMAAAADAAQGPEVVAHAVDKGACELVVKALLAYPAVNNLQVGGLLAMANLTKVGMDGAAAARLRWAGGLQA